MSRTRNIEESLRFFAKYLLVHPMTLNMGQLSRDLIDAADQLAALRERVRVLEEENERLAQERALLYVGITTLDPVYSNQVTRYILENRTLPPPKSIVADELEKLATVEEQEDTDA